MPSDVIFFFHSLQRNARRPIDDDDNDKDWTTEESSDGEIRPKHSLNRGDDLVTPSATRRRQSVSRERQMMMATDAKSNIVDRPTNPATKYYGKGGLCAVYDQLNHFLS